MGSCMRRTRSISTVRLVSFIVDNVYSIRTEGDQLCNGTVGDDTPQRRHLSKKGY